MLVHFYFLSELLEDIPYNDELLIKKSLIMQLVYIFRQQQVNFGSYEKNNRLVYFFDWNSTICWKKELYSLADYLLCYWIENSSYIIYVRLIRCLRCGYEKWMKYALNKKNDVL